MDLGPISGPAAFAYAPTYPVLSAVNTKEDRLKPGAIAVLTCVLAGCAEVSLKEDAKSVRLVFTESLVAKCSFRGDVVGSEGHWFNSWLIPNDTLSYAALNDLRNHAHEKGADTVFVPGVPNLFRTSVTIIGQAYRCQ